MPQDLGLKASGLLCVSAVSGNGSGFILVLGFGVQGLVFRIWDLGGFRIYSLSHLRAQLQLGLDLKQSTRMAVYSNLSL